MQVEVEVETRLAGILADQARVIGLINRGLKRLTLPDIFAANIDVAGIGPHGEGRDQRAFDQRMGIMAHDLPVLAGAGFGFVGVDDEVGGAPVRLLGHERPFEAGRKARAAAPAQARRLDDVHDLVASKGKQVLGAVPMPALLRAGEGAVMHPVEVGEDPVLILQHA